MERWPKTAPIRRTDVQVQFYAHEIFCFCSVSTSSACCCCLWAAEICLLKMHVMTTY